MKVSIVATGMGQLQHYSVEARKAVLEAQVLIGAKRLITNWDTLDCLKLPLIDSKEIFNQIQELKVEHVVVLMSGDIGFYSGTKKLYELLTTKKEIEVTLYPGVSTVQYMAARIGKTWQELALTSAHGIECNVIGTVLSHRESFFLTGGTLTVKTILYQLKEAGFSDLEIYIGSNLGAKEEQIFRGKLEGLMGRDYDSLSCIWVVRETLYRDQKVKIQDQEFIRAKVPMTKGEVRTLICDYFPIKDGDVIYDLGAGTGSVAVQFSLKYPMAKVKAVEINPDACSLILENREKFQAYNLEVLEGEASEQLVNLEKADHVFIGGSKGNLEEMVKLILLANKNANILISAVTLEALNLALNVMKRYFEDEVCVVQINIARTNKLGSYQMLAAENPIFLIGRKI